MTARRSAVLLLLGIGLTDLSFRVAQVAVPLVVLAGTGSAGATGLVAGASGLPVLLSPWWARRLRHRVRSGRAVALCYLGEAASLAGVAAMASVDGLSVLVLASCGLALGCAEALSGPGRDALLADLGDRLGDDRALSLLNTRDLFRRVSMVVGPVIGGLGVATGHGLWLLWVEVATILVSAGLAVPVPPTAAAVDPESGATIRAVLAGRRQVRLGWVVRGAGCALWFGFTLGLSVLGAERGRAGVYLAAGMTAYGIGSVLGTIGVVRLLRVLPVLPAICWAWLVTGGCWVAMGLFPSITVIGAAGFVSGFAVVVGNAGVTATITRTSAGAERRTLLAGQSVVVNATSSLGLLAGGPLLATLGATRTLVVTGLLTAAVAAGVLQVAGGRRAGPGAVAATEQAGVHEQREQLVNAGAVLPAVGERCRLGVRVEDARQVRQPEQREHRQVGLAVAAVGGGVDDPDALLGAPQDVAVPQVAVQPGRLLFRHQLGQPGDDSLDALGVVLADPAAVAGELEVRQHPTLPVELRPRGRRLVEHRQPRDEAVGVPAVRRRAGLVGRREGTAESGRRVGRGAAGLDPAQDQAAVVGGEHGRDRDPARRGQPLEAR
jgi:MFS family permease